MKRKIGNCLEIEKLRNMKVTLIQIVIGALGSHQRIGASTGGLGNKRTSGDHPKLQH